MNRTCPVVVDRCVCVDPPVLNLSSEAPDPLVFVGRIYNPFNPWKPNCLTCDPEKPGKMHDCNGVVYSYTSQTAADLLAKLAGIICVNGEGAQFSSEEQTATKTCADGSTSSFTVPAGYFVSPKINSDDAAAWLAAANAAALAYAQQQVGAQAPCIGGSGSGGGGVPQPKLADRSNWCCLGEDLTDTFYSLTGPNSEADYIFNVTSGSLPPGTSLIAIDKNTAELTGTPTTPGTYTFVITATRSDLNWMGAVCTATFYVFGLVGGGVLPPATACTDYSHQLQADGGEGAITYTIDPNLAPNWVSVSTSGLITGQPAQSDAQIDFEFDIIITDSTGATCGQRVSIFVEDYLTNCFTNTSLPTADTLTHSYSAQLIPSDPTTSAYGYTLVSGAFPAGISLNPVTGLISGDPFGAAQATYNVKIGLTGVCWTCEHDFTILAQCGGDTSDTPVGTTVNRSTSGTTTTSFLFIQRTGAPQNLNVSITGDGTSTEALGLSVSCKVKRVSDDFDFGGAGVSLIFGGPPGACTAPPYDWPLASGPNPITLQSCVPYRLETSINLINPTKGIICPARITSVVAWV
jgi:hypothetical protein